MPEKYVVIHTKKQLHGWYPGKRECTAERMLINPYNGCEVNCFYCYARALPGYFEKFHRDGTVFISGDFDRIIEEQLDSINIASCGYLSPVTDPFQNINSKYKLSEKIIKVFIKKNIPIEFITKSKIPPEVIEIIKGNKHSFGQVSILTSDENLRKIFSPSGATVNELFNNLNLLAKNNIYCVCRIDPIFPYITDNRENLINLIKKAIDSGARHIIASVVDIPVKLYKFFMNKIKNFFGENMLLKYKNLYTENIGYINAKIDYRKQIFDFLRQTCDKLNITFALCMEYEKENGNILGLNKIYMTSVNCEGIDIPVYIRKGDKFFPAADCKGNCLNCKKAICGIPDLSMASKQNSRKSFKLKDYRNWSQKLATTKTLKI